MASLSVAVLGSSGKKLGYKSFRKAMADVDQGLAIKESDRCIRMLPAFSESVGVEWRTRKSGPNGPLVRQVERFWTEEEQNAKEEQ
jgi:hypothetical protein